MNTKLKLFERHVEYVISELLIVEGSNSSLDSWWGRFLIITEYSDGHITIPPMFNTYLDDMLGTDNDHHNDNRWNLLWHQQDDIIRKIYRKRKNNDQRTNIK